MSESVFVGLCKKVGTSQLVALRRETIDMKEMVGKQVTPNDGIIEMLSGSTREGFRLKGSDMDMMFWLKNHRVIMDMSQSEYYNTSNTTLILSDSSESPPGFTLLQLLTTTTSEKVQTACVRMNDRIYMSSSLYRHLTCSSFYPTSTEHGPCGTGNLDGFEYDTAMCFVCDSWPPSASSWIDRCHSWPSPEVVHDIVRNGCHFVAIGHPLGIHENEEHIDTTLSQAALGKLQVLVHHDQGLYVFYLYRDISWEILGICQQMAGNVQAALYSYRQSLTQHPSNGIQTVTHMRIQDVVSQLNN
uniref:Mab-21-like nucleotidyltransferase domain-containing protein n=1 Tax=Magallana gigas TaxID=29159 RepID=K1PP91_MAGGI